MIEEMLSDTLQKQDNEEKEKLKTIKEKMVKIKSAALLSKKYKYHEEGKSFILPENNTRGHSYIMSHIFVLTHLLSHYPEKALKKLFWAFS